MAYRQALLSQMKGLAGFNRREDDPTDDPENRPGPGGGGIGDLPPSPEPSPEPQPGPGSEPLPPSAPPVPDLPPGGGPGPNMPMPEDQAPPLPPEGPLVPGGQDTGPGGITGHPGGIGGLPGGAGGAPTGPTAGGPWLTGDPTRDPVRQFVLNVLSKNGKQASGHGSGPTDIEYLVDRILAEGGLNTGYDWEGRIVRGLNGTQPAEGGGGGKAGPATGATGGIPPQLAEYYRMLQEQMRQQQEKQAGVDAALRDSLLKLMAQGQEPVDVTKGNLGAAAEAYRNAQRREQGQSRNQLAERAAFLGLNSGGQGSGSFETSLNGLDENVRNNIAGNEANLALGEMQQKRGMMMQALQIAQALGARTEANALQSQLAQMDSLMRMYALQQQQGQFEDTNVFNWAELQAAMNRAALMEGMG